MYCMDLTLLAHEMVAQGISYHEGCATDDSHGRVFWCLPKENIGTQHQQKERCCSAKLLVT